MPRFVLRHFVVCVRRCHDDATKEFLRFFHFVSFKVKIDSERNDSGLSRFVCGDYPLLPLQLVAGMNIIRLSNAFSCWFVAFRQISTACRAVESIATVFVLSTEKFFSFLCAVNVEGCQSCFQSTHPVECSRSHTTQSMTAAITLPSIRHNTAIICHHLVKRYHAMHLRFDTRQKLCTNNEFSAASKKTYKHTFNRKRDETTLPSMASQKRNQIKSLWCLFCAGEGFFLNVSSMRINWIQFIKIITFFGRRWNIHASNRMRKFNWKISCRMSMNACVRKQISRRFFLVACRKCLIQ